MLLYGVMMVRNEADIIALNIRHHLAHGVDRMLVLDNGSSDGTDGVLEELSRDSRIQWTRSTGAFQQADMTTELAREAFLRGAEWVLPIDADEFWWAPAKNFKTVLQESAAGALQVQIVNFIQRREQQDACPAALQHMTRRAILPSCTPEQAVELVQAHEIGFVEFPYPPKCISRASISLQIGQGNHSVAGVAGPQEATDEIVCLHAPLRARAVLESKVDHGRRAEEVAQYLVQAWHVRRWRRLAEGGQLDREWAANSYEDDHLDVYGHRHPVIFDPSLKRVLEPRFHEDEAVGRTKSRSFPALPLQLRSEASNEQSDDQVNDLLFTLYGPNARPDALFRSIVRNRIEDVEGWLREGEIDLLIDLAWDAIAPASPYAVVEIGSYHGKSTIVLGTVGQAVAPRPRIVAIDPHEGHVGAADSFVGTHFGPPSMEAFTRNITQAGLESTVELIQQRSYEVTWTRPINLLFIDGLHDYLNVSRDFCHFDSWIVPGGYVAFHDCEEGFPGVKAFVDELVESRRYRKIRQVQSIAVLQKPARHGRATTAATGTA